MSASDGGDDLVDSLLTRSYGDTLDLDFVGCATFAVIVDLFNGFTTSRFDTILSVDFGAMNRLDNFVDLFDVPADADAVAAFWTPATAFFADDSPPAALGDFNRDRFDFGSMPPPASSNAVRESETDSLDRHLPVDVSIEPVMKSLELCESSSCIARAVMLTLRLHPQMKSVNGGFRLCGQELAFVVST